MLRFVRIHKLPTIEHKAHQSDEKCVLFTVYRQNKNTVARLSFNWNAKMAYHHDKTPKFHFFFLSKSKRILPNGILPGSQIDPTHNLRPLLNINFRSILLLNLAIWSIYRLLCNYTNGCGYGSWPWSLKKVTLIRKSNRQPRFSGSEKSRNLLSYWIAHLFLHFAGLKSRQYELFTLEWLDREWKIGDRIIICTNTIWRRQ